MIKLIKIHVVVLAVTERHHSELTGSYQWNTIIQISSEIIYAKSALILQTVQHQVSHSIHTYIHKANIPFSQEPWTWGNIEQGKQEYKMLGWNTTSGWVGFYGMTLLPKSVHGLWRVFSLSRNTEPELNRSRSTTYTISVKRFLYV